MKISLVSMGPGDSTQLTVAAAQAIAKADCLIGAARLLDRFCGESIQCVPLALPEKMIDYLNTHQEAQHPCILLSGDSGFYSAAGKLVQHFGMDQIEIFPGVSSVSYFASRLGIPWQDWHLVSAHGVECDIVSHVANFEKAFALTGGTQTPASLCKELDSAGFGDCMAYVGQSLSYPEEAIVHGTVRELSNQNFPSLSVILILNPHAKRERGSSFGLPDEKFVRGAVPMTKSEVRSVILSKLRIRDNDVLWDIGAGTGSVSVEMALAARFGKVYAVECSQEGCHLIAENAKQFQLHNLTLIPGMAPEVCAHLPAPNAVFIGGSKGNLKGILDTVLRKNPKARVCISAITIETVAQAMNLFHELGLENIEAVQVSIAKTKRAGHSHLLMANNPVFVISAEGRDNP